ncbi:hypothetical protein HZA57_04945 [Candidatus Poribacteria bacterium]|nr:hypothetical protein [Candidatus Poribacteria bacterium]
MMTILTRGRRHSNRAFTTDRELIAASAICALLFCAVCLADDILPYASNDGATWPNVYSPLTTQAVFQDGLWSGDDRHIQFAHRFQWMRAASYNALSTPSGHFSLEGARASCPRFAGWKPAPHSARYSPDGPLSNLTSASGPGGTRESAAALDPSKAITVFVWSTTGVGAVLQAVLTRGVSPPLDTPRTARGISGPL